MSGNIKDDVDRLFECFKCGISPPQSALRERKRRKSKLREASLTDKSSTSSRTLSPESAQQMPSTSFSTLSPKSAQQRQNNAIDVHLSMEKFCSETAKARKFVCGKQVSPVVFYGSPHGVRPKRPASLLKLLREIRIDISEQNKDNLGKKVWATFPRQDEAMKFAKGHGDFRVFSYQDHIKGQRRFLVSTYEEFWRRYKDMDSKFRHHYEVIQEGLPCHLYFDLEFSTKNNAEKNVDEMVDLLISVIMHTLLEKYCIQGSEEWIVELDSSTAEKFSRHLILRIPKTAFQDNSHVGAFVAEICSHISRTREANERLENLFVKKESSSAEGPTQLFLDTAVYTRNRCFRLALSSKAGKRSVLLPSGRFKCQGMSEEEMFMASLICKMDDDCEKLLICKMDLECVKTLHFDTEENHYLQKHRSRHQEFDASRTYYMGKSPFPTLDAFVESIATIGSVSGKIQSWYWFSEYGLMVYSMSRNRYCERIGRQHKSNHVMYVIDLRREVYYQKCYDPDCSGYRSPSRPVPIEAIPDVFTSSNSEHMDHYGESTNNDLGYLQIKNDVEHNPIYSDGSITDSCSKDSWWLEAVRVANNIESMQNVSLLSAMEKADDEVEDEDENWWMAVERTASQIELTQSS